MTNPHVLSFSAADVSGKTTRFTVGTDIIDYIESSRVFGREDLSDPNADGRFQRRMIAIPDKKGNVVTPMVLTISNQNQLYLVRKDDESKSGDGWKLIDVSAAFKPIIGDSVRVRAHAAGWTADDRITIAVAIDDSAGDRSRVFVAYNLSSQTSDWENIPWIDCGSREHVRVEGIRVLNGGDNVWTIVLAGDRGPNDMLYLLRSTMNKPAFAQALVFNPAVTLEEILDFEVAVHPLQGSGIAVLGTNGGSCDLSFRAFPKYDASGRFVSVPPIEPLPCPAGATVLEIGQTKLVEKARRHSYFGSDIYVGGQGVHQISARDILDKQSRAAVIIAPDLAPNVQDLIVGEAADGSISVWSLLQNGDLNMVRKADIASDWSQPLRLRVGVQAIAPVHGDEHLTTSLLMVYASGQAAFLARDASQEIWLERPLAVANPEEANRVTCYGTTLRVLSEGNLPKLGIRVKVTASVLSSVVLNGNAVFIGPTVAFETETDQQGSVSLFDRVRSFTPAIYRFEVDGFENCFDVNPAGMIHQRFQSIAADELKAAKISTSVGEVPLLPESFRTGADQNQVDMVAGSLNQVATLSNSTNGVVAGVTQVQADQPFSSQLLATAASPAYSWGIQMDEKGIKVIEGSAIARIVSAAESVGSFFKTLGDSIGDFFEGIYQGFKQGGFKGALTFVLHKAKAAAGEVYEFICAIGNQVKRFVLKSLEQIGGVFQWLWEQCKASLEKVWEYLKFAFDWNDILRVRDLMVEATDVALKHLEKSIDLAKGQVHRGFDVAIQSVENWKSPASRTSKSPETLITVGQNNQLHQDKVAQSSGNSAMSWIMERLQSLSDEIIKVEGLTIEDDVVKVASEFAEGVIKDISGELSDILEQLSEITTRLFGSGAPEPDSFNIDKIKTLIVDAGAELIISLLQMVQKLLLRVLDVIKALIGFVRKLMLSTIRFPFIEKMLKLVTGGVLEVNTSFRLIDAIALLCAMPATLTYKILFGEAPIKAGDVIRIPFDDAVLVQSSSDSGTFPILKSLGLSMAGLLFNIYQLMGAAADVTTPPSAGAKLLGVGLLTVTLAGEVYGLPDFEEPTWFLSFTPLLLTSLVWGLHVADFVVFYRNPQAYIAPNDGKTGTREVKDFALILSSICAIPFEIIAAEATKDPDKEVAASVAHSVAVISSRLSTAVAASVTFFPTSVFGLTATTAMFRTVNWISVLLEIGIDRLGLPSEDEAGQFQPEG